MTTPSTHYLNADFDLSLRPRTDRLGRPTILRQVDELSVQALLGASADDAVLIRGYLPEYFLDSLAGRGVELPRILTHPETDMTTTLRPFGWSAEAIELNRSHRHPARHPPIATIERVNGRGFALELDDEGTPIHGSSELETFLQKAAPGTEWVVKAEHGNSALANRRLRAPSLSAVDRRFVDALFAEDDRAVVEPWRTRERDFGVVFDVPFDASRLRIHETLCTTDGAFYGAIFEPGGPEGLAHAGELEAIARRVAARLEEEGYFGPVCTDAFTWRDGDRVRLRPLVDLNCRRSMTDPVDRLWRKMFKEQTVLYRFFNGKKLSLPREPPDDDGVLFASPTCFAKVAVMFTGATRADVRAKERRFRERYAR